MQFNIIIEKDEGGWFIATVPSLPGCHTQAQNIDDLFCRIREAILLYLDVNGTPPLEELRSFVGVQIVDVETC
ncbi:MAG: type II toxin-antitoxin system HicB family antitoxin [Methanospirillaceae archaeon]|nr:type II toxin-antitoxin system HicB family antitoxin [Methanospirillaceae archaeon]